MRCSILTTPKDHMEAAYSLFAFAPFDYAKRKLEKAIQRKHENEK